MPPYSIYAPILEVYANERTKIMKSQLEETKQKIIELLVRYGFPKFGVGYIYSPERIYVESKRDDMPEGEGISMTIRRSGHHWYLTMSDDDRPYEFKDDVGLRATQTLNYFIFGFICS